MAHVDPRREDGPKTRHLDVDAHTIHYRALDTLAPDGAPPIVFVHGQLVASGYMLPTLRTLAPSFPCYAPDLPGYGDSSKPSVILDVEDLAMTLVRFIEELGLKQPTLLANSFGCSIATAAALHYPGLIDRLILQGPTMDPAARGPIRSLWRGIKDLGTERPPRDLVGHVQRTGLRRSLATWRLMYSDPIEDRLPKIATPTLVVRGARDPIVSAQWAQRFTELMPEAKLVTLTGAHTLVWNEPVRLAKLIREWMETEREPSRLA